MEKLWENFQNKNSITFIMYNYTDLKKKQFNRYVRGKDNPVADTLSIADNVQLWIDYQDIAKAKQEDVKVQAYCSATSNLQLEDIPCRTRDAKN